MINSISNATLVSMTGIDSAAAIFNTAVACFSSDNINLTIHARQSVIDHGRKIAIIIALRAIIIAIAALHISADIGVHHIDANI